MYNLALLLGEPKDVGRPEENLETLPSLMDELHCQYQESC
jgi:hypothetical protein